MYDYYASLAYTRASAKGFSHVSVNIDEDITHCLKIFCSKHKRVLDVGCGPFELIALGNNANVVGIDISKTFLRILLNCGFRGTVVQCDCQHLPFKKQSFDGLISNQLIEHMTSLTRVKETISEMQRVSEDTIVVTPNSAFYRRMHDPTHFFFFTVKDLEKIMPSFRIYASNIPPKETLGYYFLYGSPRLRKMPFIGPLIFNVFRIIDSSKFLSLLNKKLWVGRHLIAVRKSKHSQITRSN